METDIQAVVELSEFSRYGTKALGIAELAISLLNCVLIVGKLLLKARDRKQEIMKRCLLDYFYCINKNDYA